MDKDIYVNYKTYLEMVEILGYIPENLFVNNLLENNTSVLVDRSLEYDKIKR